MAGNMAGEPILERFFSYVDKTDYCWNWTGFKSKKDVLDIFKMTSARYFSHEKLAKMYGVSRPTITFILNNKRWKHLNSGGIPSQLPQ